MPNCVIAAQIRVSVVETQNFASHPANVLPATETHGYAFLPVTATETHGYASLPVTETHSYASLRNNHR